MGALELDATGADFFAMMNEEGLGLIYGGALDFEDTS